MHFLQWTQQSYYLWQIFQINIRFFLAFFVKFRLKLCQQYWNFLCNVSIMQNGDFKTEACYPKWRKAKRQLISFKLLIRFLFRHVTFLLPHLHWNHLKNWFKKFHNFPQKFILQKSFICTIKMLCRKESCYFLLLWLLEEYMCGYRIQKVPKFSITLKWSKNFWEKVSTKNW